MKYWIAVVIVFGLCVFVSREDQEARQQYEEKCNEFNARAATPPDRHEDCDEGAENAARHLPRWYRVFSWPEGITTWGILLTLLAIAEQTHHTGRAADASLQAIRVSSRQTEHLIASERAWVLGEVIPNEFASVLSDTNIRGIMTTGLSIKLRLRNEGRSPAWVDGIFARADIVSNRSEIVEYGESGCPSHGGLQPIGAGSEGEKPLFLVCDGCLKDGKFVTIFILVIYRDVFDITRHTTVGYSIDKYNPLMRQAGPSRNKHT